MSWLWVLACSSAPVQAPSVVPEAPRPDLVLLLVDRLRAHGAADDAVLARLPAPDAVLDGYAASSLAFPSLGALLVGTYPSAAPLCGLTTRGEQDPAVRPWCAALPPARSTLPGALGAYGYRTALFTSGLAGAEELGEAFQHADALDAPVAWTELQERAVAWWEGGGPRLPVVVTSELDLARRGEDGDLSAAYAAAADATGEGLAGLPAGLDGEPLVVLAGLTGTSLGEHGGSPEGSDTFAEQLLLDLTLHVPVALWGEVAPQPGPVELIDLGPTLLDWAGAAPLADVAGGSLTEPVDGRAYAELGDQLVLRDGPWPLSWRAMFHNASALDPHLDELLARAETSAPPRLHHVVDDPLQQQALGGRSEAEALLRTLRQTRAGPAAPAPEARSSQRLLELRMTRAEGYW